MKCVYIWKTFFEYFFYKIAKLNIKFTKPDRAIASVSGVQFLIVLNIIIFFYSLLVPPPLPRESFRVVLNII
jgi:hypothetical protein